MNGKWHSTLALLALLGACTVSEADKGTKDSSAGSATPAATPAPATAAAGATTTTATPDSAATAGATTAGSNLRMEVNVKARTATLFDGDKVLETHKVAVGSAKWPTQPGEWTIKQVVFNPEWTPPDESWAEEREPRKPGDPKNPLGMAQLVYDPPRTIHGTNQPSSIGTATSHGSIRMRNEEIVALGKRLLAAEGAAKDEAWYQRVATERTTKQIVDLPRPVPIKVF